MAKDYYKEIDEGLKSYEDFRPYHRYKMAWLCDRIAWCWKFRKITNEELDELTDRMIWILENCKEV